MRYLIVAGLILHSGFCIGEEFLPEDVSEIKSLTVEQAAELVVKFEGQELHLQGLASIDKEVARELAKFKGRGLYLEGLTEIDKDVAKELAGIKGRDPRPRLLLGLTSIDKEVARELAKFTGMYLYLKSLTAINKEVAKELVKVKGPKVYLNYDLTSIDPDALKLLKAKPAIWGLASKKHSLPLQTSVQVPLRHQRCVTGFCSVTCASIVLDSIGLQVPPQTFHQMTGGSPFFIDLCRAANRLGFPWSEKHFANNPDGFMAGMNLIRTLLLAKCPVIVDLSNAFGTNESHVYIVCGFSDEQKCVFILDPHSVAPGIKKLSYIELSWVWNSLGIKVGQPANIRGMIAIR